MAIRRSERGSAILEAGVWMTMLLPVTLLSVSVVATVHDQNVLQVVPDAVLREVRIPPLRWIPNGHGGHYDVEVAELRDVVSTLSRNALAEAQGEVFKARHLSSKACFWIFSVHSSTGKLESPISHECDARGPLGSELSVDNLVHRELSTSLGIPRDRAGSTSGFVNRVVVAGVVVGGEVPELLDAASATRVSYGAVSFPRQEITL
jgi:hypothetical protein